MIRPKVNLIQELKDRGYSTYRIRRERIIGQASLTKIRAGGLPSWNELDKICTILRAQPGDLVEHVEEDPDGFSAE